MNLEEATIKALNEEVQDNVVNDNYRAVELRDASSGEVYRIIMLNNKHSVADFQNAMNEAYDRNREQIMEYGDDVETVLEDIDPSFDWFELNYDEDYLTI